jgi:hypothetical protein
MSHSNSNFEDTESFFSEDVYTNYFFHTSHSYLSFEMQLRGFFDLLFPTFPTIWNI